MSLANSKRVIVLGGSIGRGNSDVNIDQAIDLSVLCKHELLSAERYRRFVSLVLVGSGNGPLNLTSLLTDMVRESDAYVELDDSAAILMSETDGAGALAAVERYQVLYGDGADLRCAVVSYPRDVRGPDEMIATAHQRFHRARAGDSGAIVSED